jgi:hypothetical protein
MITSVLKKIRKDIDLSFRGLISNHSSQQKIYSTGEICGIFKKKLEEAGYRVKIVRGYFKNEKNMHIWLKIFNGDGWIFIDPLQKDFKINKHYRVAAEYDYLEEVF